MDDSTAFHSVRDYKLDEDKEVINVGDYVAVFGGIKVGKGEAKTVFMNAFKIVKLNDKGKGFIFDYWPGLFSVRLDVRLYVD